jgi:hypothetical protein
MESQISSCLLKARRGINDAVDESGAIIAADADEGTPDLG